MTLLDTHVLLWLAGEPGRLSRKAAQQIRNESAGGRLAIAAITCWEIAQLCARKRIGYVGSIAAFLDELTSRTEVLPLTPAIAAQAVDFPASFPKDPADRMIAATAIAHAIPLISKDDAMRRSDAVTTIW